MEAHGSDYIVYREGELVYDCMLNQTNLQYNNNKFYLIQLLQQVNTKEYVVWLRWGRVGKNGQTNMIECGDDLRDAKNIFGRKFYDKTYNKFEQKDNFEKCQGKYDLVEKDYSATQAPAVKLDSTDQAQTPVSGSKLHIRLQKLIELICNVKEMENLLKEMKFDSKKAPLGKLSKSQIKAGYAALKEIEEHLNKKNFGKAFTQANNDFYTRIPHDFGMKTPPLISTLAQMREKMKLLEVN